MNKKAWPTISGSFPVRGQAFFFVVWESLQSFSERTVVFFEPDSGFPRIGLEFLPGKNLASLKGVWEIPEVRPKLYLFAFQDSC